MSRQLLLSCVWSTCCALADVNVESVPASGMIMQGQLSQGHAGGDFLARHFSLAGYPKHGLSEWWPTVQLGLAWIAITWYCFVWAVCFVGYIQIRKRYSKRPIPASKLKDSTENLPFVSVLRPIKGYDSHLSVTLNSIFLLDYPVHLHELLFCVASPQDPCISVVRSLIARYPSVNARLVLGEEDVGPNPKIRTLSKGYREAKGDVVWMLDSNIWVAPGVMRRSVNRLCGIDETGNQTKKPFKFVHHLPVGVACIEEPLAGIDIEARHITPQPSSTSLVALFRKFIGSFGGRLEETFLSTSHAKFYTAINTVGIAPCVLGKSNMFRKSHLAAVTPAEAPGILDFAHNICEDHMLAERIWLVPLPEERNGTEKWGKHALGEDLVFQPMANMKVQDYWDRRTRWLRVRKYAIIAATLAEPETESFLCSFVGGYGFITLLERYKLTEILISPENWSKWIAIFYFWLLSVTVWSICDYVNFKVLHGFEHISIDKNTPRFVRDVREKWVKRVWEGSLRGWLFQWIGREALALPVFLWAMLPGDVRWRGGRYRVGWDMKVRQVGEVNGVGKRRA